MWFILFAIPIVLAITGGFCFYRNRKMTRYNDWDAWGLGFIVVSIFMAMIVGFCLLGVGVSTRQCDQWAERSTMLVEGEWTYFSNCMVTTVDGETMPYSRWVVLSGGDK